MERKIKRKKHNKNNDTQSKDRKRNISDSWEWSEEKERKLLDKKTKFLDENILKSNYYTTRKILMKCVKCVWKCVKEGKKRKCKERQMEEKEKERILKRREN